MKTKILLAAYVVGFVVFYGPISWSETCGYHPDGRQTDVAGRAQCGVTLSLAWPIYLPLRASWALARP